MLKEKTLAPNFTLPNQRGELRTLSDFKGQTVVLYFYPKDNTPGCTVQACTYRDNMSVYTKAGIKVFGVSKDTVKSHQKFEKDFDLNFELLADDQLEVIQAYGVWKEKNMYGKKVMGVARTTFVINPEGVISHIFEKVDPKSDPETVLKVLGKL